MKIALTTLTFLAAAFAVSTASARIPYEECSVDADCPESFTCIIEEYGACPPCIPDEDCGSCTSDSYSYCSPPPPEQCDTDADCEGNYVCVSYTYEACSGWDLTCAVDPDSDDQTCEGPDTDDFECETHSEAYCVPPYFAPCEVDADCGGGFTCQTAEICECSGGGSTEPFPGDDSGSDAPEPVDCVCTPSDTKYCELIHTTCDSNSDCASGLTCVQDVYYDYPSQSEDPTEPEGRSGDEPTVSPEPTVESYCAPEGYWGSPTSSGGSLESSPAADAKSAERVNWGADGNGTGDKGDGGGCTTVNGNAPLGLLGLFGLLALRLRRR